MKKARRSGNGLGAIHRRILAVLENHPEGISLNAIHRALGIISGEQLHFDRRFRDLYRTHRIEKKRVGREVLYVLLGVRTASGSKPTVNKTLRAAVLHAARGRCSMCGRSIAKHGVELVVDHKIPQAWGGRSDHVNLWALCTECNEGKWDFFASVDSPEIRASLGHDSVHVRIGELLKAYVGRPLPSEYIDIVAGQRDWPKRLRELRYLGWRIQPSRSKLASGRVASSYRLERAAPWPRDPTGTIREYERERAARNRRSSRRQS